MKRQRVQLNGYIKRCIMLMKHIATYQIRNTFGITGRGIVLTGKILSGDIFLTGDLIEFEFNGQTFKRRIKGIDNGMRVEQEEPDVGIILETQDENETADLRNWNPNMIIGKIYTDR
ncbi:MAG: hypothetical protein WA960_08675 [Tunicatimonas sp.]